MGAFDQFKDQADEYADKARNAMGNKRDKARNPQEQDPMERGSRPEPRPRDTEFDDEPNRRMDRDADSEPDWA